MQDSPTKLNFDIISFNTGHDCSIAYVSNGTLVASIEAEKNSRRRFFSQPTLSDFSDLYHRANNIKKYRPNTICIIGDYEKREQTPFNVYYGENYSYRTKGKFFGQEVDLYSASHERAHIFCGYSLSPFPQGKPSYCLVWEGGIGAFYKINEGMKVKKLKDIIHMLGFKYKFLYVLAGGTSDIHDNSPGKTMALSAYAKNKSLKKYREAILYLLYKENDVQKIKTRFLQLKEEYYNKFKGVVPYNTGIEHQHYAEFSWAFQEIVFSEFYKFAKKRMTERLPLIISGGCALNCYWNQKWVDSGLFSAVFVPPCANDSGIAVGLAASAQFNKTGYAKIRWNVYSGEDFIHDNANIDGYVKYPFTYKNVANLLGEKNTIIAWVQGRYEMGPRALCNRSLLAAPFNTKIRDRLNEIKKREMFRPVAPVCKEEAADKYFDCTRKSPFMLFFNEVKSKELKAITHVDGSSRLQTVSKKENAKIYQLLDEFETITGYPILCNTSLNFPGKGFINKRSDLFEFARQSQLDGVVCDGVFYIKANYKGIFNAC